MKPTLEKRKDHSKARFLEHKRPGCSSSEVSRHINKDKPEHDVHIDDARILHTRSGKRGHRLSSAGQVTRHVS